MIRDPKARPCSVARGPVAATSVVIAVLALAACDDDEKTAPASASAQPTTASSAAPAVSAAIPIDPAKVAAAVNPKGRAPYTGPTGSVAGAITVKGDSAYRRKDVENAIGKRCPKAADHYAPLFREGEGRRVADVLVTVTGYTGKYLPAKKPSLEVHAKDCTWGARTLAVMYGQRIDVFNDDLIGHMPKLVGAHSPAVFVALPGAKEPTKLYPDKVGRMALVDMSNPFMTADVFVVKFPTFDVTGPDGRYVIRGVPVGKVDVNAVLVPIAGLARKRDVEVVEGQTTRVDLELTFDAKALEKKQPTGPASSVH